jgi:hypothetical protein
MKFFQVLTVAAGLLGAVAVAQAQSASPPKLKNVVLVHRAWADGSSWAEVIPKLQALAEQDGPTVLVAHSRGRNGHQRSRHRS